MEHNVWSLVGDKNVKNLNAEVEALKEKYEKFKEKNYVRRNLRIVRYIIFFFVALGIIPFLLILLFTGIPIPHFILFPLVFGFVVYFIMKAYYGRIVVDMVKYEVARKNGWHYEPDRNRGDWKVLRDKFPEIFRKGTGGQFVDDQFFGDIYSGGRSYNFHSGIFSYTVKHGKSSSTYFRHFFAFRLNKKIHSRFCLYPENVGSKISNFFTRKEIDLESNEFNRVFAFSYSGSKTGKQLDILSILTPSMQLKLLELYNRKGAFNVIFDGDAVVFDFHGKILRRYKTDFSKSNVINPEDKKFLNSVLVDLVSVMQEIAGRLD